jgi:arylsulfatase A-like enzyme
MNRLFPSAVAGFTLLSCWSLATEVHHYRLDETFQHQVVSDSAGGVHATAPGLGRGLAGVLAGAFEFSETDLDVLDLGSAANLLPAGDFTITAWVRASADGFDENERILDCSNGDSFAQMNLGLNFKKQGGTLRAFVGDGIRKVATPTSPSNSALVAETWHLVVFRFTASSDPGTLADGSARVTAIPLGSEMVDAATVGSLTDSASHSLGPIITTTPLLVGSPSATAATVGLAFDGLIDDLRIHDTVLTDQQLVDLHSECVAAAPSLRWIFNIDGDPEGWSGSGLSGLEAIGGNLSATLAGGTAGLLSPENLDLPLTRIARVFLKARNDTPLTTGTLSFQTSEHLDFSANAVDFTLVANDPGYATYEVDMSAHPNWRGTLKRLRIELPEGAPAGSGISFDRIAIGASGNRPNVIVMMADDLGWRDVTVNGSPFYETPNVERIAAAGMNFPNSYSANPLCSPTRAAVLTGLYPARVRFNTPSGHVANVELDPGVSATANPYLPSTTVGTRTRLPNGYVTYAELLRKEGYATAFIGKWHLGMDEYIPENQGFDFVIGGREHSGPPGGYFGPFPAGSNIPTNWPDGTPVASGDHVNDILAAWTADFIETKRHQPFLVNLWWYDVHGPFQAKPALRDKYLAKRAGNPDPEGRQDSPTMAAMVEVMDDGIGVVLDKLEALGLRDDTVIIFTGDNGGWMYSWIAEDLAVPTDNHPSRAGKACIWDGGTRVPFIVEWPGVVPPGTTSDDLVNNLDIYATILDITGVEAYDGYPLDSKSLVPSLTGGEPANGDIIFNQFPQAPPATGTFPGVWVRQGDMKLIRFFHGNGGQDKHRYELYNIALDPGEEHNLADAHSEPGGLVETMDALITEHLVVTDSLVPVANPNYVPPVFDRWTPNHGVWVQNGANGALKMVSNSFLPALDSPELPTLAAPAMVRVRMTSRSYGDGRIWWRDAAGEAWDPANSVAFPVTHDNSEREMEIPISPGGPVHQVRFQPSSGYFETDVVSIEILDAAGHAIETLSLVDSDGDGTADSDERAAHRNPNDPSDLAFEFSADGDPLDWAPQNTGAFAISGGRLAGTAITNDPQIQRTGFSFAADQVPFIYFKLKAAGNGVTQFFWGREGADSFAAARRLDLQYSGGGDWQVIEVPVSSSALAAEWNGRTITRMRIDPIDLAATSYEIDWIRGSDGDHDGDGISDAAEGFPSRDSDNDGIEDWADTDSDNDGVPDFAENSAGRDPYNAVESTLNADGDAYSDLFEMLSGTDPDDHSDHFDLRFSVSPDTGGQQVTAAFEGRTGRRYRLLRSLDLGGDWTQVDEASALSDGTMEMTDTLSETSAFYSIHVIWHY